MFTYQGSVKALAGLFKTYMELIHTGIDARTYSAVGARDAEIKLALKRRFTAQTAAGVFTNPTGPIYVIDAFKGNVNGIITQASWAAGDVTAEPGGGELMTEGKLNPSGYGGDRFELGNRLIYAAADTVIYLDVTIN